VDDFLLEETERNLRALSFIQSARIAKFPQRDGTVVVVVYVSDAWTTEPQLNLGGQNRVDTVEVGLREKNFLGYGKRLDFLYANSPDSIERTYRYSDPHLFGSRWVMDTEYVSATERVERRVSVSHPYFSADTPFSIAALHEHTEEVLDEFSNNIKVSEFDQTKESQQIAGSAKVGRGRKIVSHMGLRYRKDTVHYSPNDKTTRPIPTPNDTQTIFVDYELIRNKYIKLDRVEKMTRIEDFNLGPVLSLSPGFTPRSLNGGENTQQLGGAFETRWLANKTNLYFSKFEYSGREVFSNSVNVRNAFSFRYYHRDLPMQTIVAHTRMEWGHRLDPDNQIILGGDDSLRAYKVDQFVGNRSWVMNLEDRFYFIDELLNLFSVGAAAFYDVGGAWSRGQAVSMSDLHNSVGVGLRLGLTKSSNEVIVRVDVSYRMEKVPTDDNRVVITFGTGQAF
jgi:outer membrane protein assembly factor BamA